MSITTGSVQTSNSTPLQDLWRRETSVARRFENEHATSFYAHWNQIATAAKALNGLTPSTAELNKLDNFTASTPVLPLGVKLPASGSYGLYLRQKCIAISGSYKWAATGFTHILGAWVSLSRSTAVIGVPGAWPNAPSRIKFQPTIPAATQVSIYHMSVYSNTSGMGTPVTFSTPIFTSIYALGY